MIRRCVILPQNTGAVSIENRHGDFLHFFFLSGQLQINYCVRLIFPNESYRLHFSKRPNKITLCVVFSHFTSLRHTGHLLVSPQWTNQSEVFPVNSAVPFKA